MSNTDTQVKYGSFSGRFSKFQQGLYADAQQLFAATEEQAHRLCLSFAADWGKCEKHFESEGTEFKMGSLSKDGEITLSESTVLKAKKIKASYAISIAKIRQEANKMLKLGVIFKSWTIPLKQDLELFLRGASTSEVEETLKEQALELAGK